MKLADTYDAYDLVVVGGGITGAGILREAVRSGLRTLLVERADFAWGTSSRSSKLVHGGLRYLKEGKVFLTMASVSERCRLIADAPGLVEPLGFLWPSYRGESPGRLALGLGLFVYDLMAAKRQHKRLDASSFLKTAPHVNREKLLGGFAFSDAQVDDARLVLRLIFEAESRGGHALSYTEAKAILRNNNREVTGVALRDVETGIEKEIATRAVVNATGFTAESLHPSPVQGLHLRPLRGSHIVFPFHRLPLGQAVSFMHPADHRPIFAIPWEGAVMVGTTDLDHEGDPRAEPVISPSEAVYLLEGARKMFPGLELSEKDVLATWSGVRPVLSSGHKAPSKESREHVVWTDKGLVTVTGGKLTTFRLLALDALKAAAPFMTRLVGFRTKEPVFAPPPTAPENARSLDPLSLRRLFGRYGAGALDLMAAAGAADLERIPGSNTLFAELPHAAKNENIRHLTDLLLRRVRLGFTLAGGGEEHLPRIRELCAPVLAWDDARWEAEIELYKATWKTAHSAPW